MPLADPGGQEKPGLDDKIRIAVIAAYCATEGLLALKVPHHSSSLPPWGRNTAVVSAAEMPPSAPVALW